MKCPHCGTDNADWLSKCNACGKSLGDTAQGRHCVSCGRAIGFDVNVCPYCGHDYRIPLATPAAKEAISGGMRILLYVVSFLIPIAGFIIGIVFYTRPDPQSKHVGKICIIIGIVAIFLTVGLSALLYVVVLGFGTNGGITPTATYFDQTVLDGRRVTILAITVPDVPWDDVTIQLTDGSSFATWEPEKDHLDTGPGAVQSYGYDTCGSLVVSCAVTDLSGDGYISGSDFFILYATFEAGTVYEAWLLYEPSGTKIGTGITWTD